MPFHVSTSGSGADEIIVLEETTTGTKAEIYAFGSLLNAFSILQNGEERNVVYGFQNTADAQKNITPLFQSAKLSPFVCRTKEGQYTFANHKHKFEKYYYHREALHGLIYDAIFAVKEKGSALNSAFVTLAYDYNKTDAGYPFFYRAEITYELKNDNYLTVTTRIINNSDVSIPVADGWHPYFCLGKKVDEVLLCLNADSMVEFDSKLIPTGHYSPYHHFNRLQPVLNAKFDNCFVVGKNTSQPICILRNKETGVQLNIFAEKNYPYLQLFTPENRDCIAVENLSSLPDSFNNAIGLIILEPTQHKDFVASYQLLLIGSEQL